MSALPSQDSGLSRFEEVVVTYWGTIVLISFLTAWYVFATIPARSALPGNMFTNYFYVSSETRTLGLLFGPISHISLSHLVQNCILLAIFGWKFETREPVWRYVVLLFVGAYVSLRIESLVTGHTLGVRVLSIGASGGVLAIATAATIWSRDSISVALQKNPKPSSVRELFLNHPSILVLSIGAVGIPITLMENFVYSPAIVGEYAHLSGVIIGGVYGFYRNENFEDS